MDASKAFDRVNHWTLFKKVIDMPDVFVRLLVYWYRTQNACVRWGTACSEIFTVSNGVRQGGILSPLFFNVYMDSLRMLPGGARFPEKRSWCRNEQVCQGRQKV